MLSREGTKLKFVTGPRPAQEHGENRAQNDNLMAEPENRPPPSRPDPNTDPPNFLFAGQIVTRGGNHLAVDGTPSTVKSVSAGRALFPSAHA